MTKHLVIPDGHAHFEHDNSRADWIGRLILDERPDTVIDMGDSADMPSLSGYDKGTRAAVGRSYREDIRAHYDFQDRIWSPVIKAKKKRPRRVRLIGNHEQRIDRALDADPVLQGTIGYKDLQNERFYDNVVYYAGNLPGSITVDGITYAHFLPSGISGRPTGGEHIGHSLLTKHHVSCVVGHNHLLDYCVRTRSDGGQLMALSSGCCFDYWADWAGNLNRLYWRGVCILNNVDSGRYDLRCISLESLRREYARRD